MRSIVAFAALALAASVLVPRYAARMNVTPAAPKAMTAHALTPVEPISSKSPSNSRSVVIAHDDHGHFQVEGRVDGRRLKFMVDTGASVIALTAGDAAMLGIHPAERDFSALVKTANGAVRTAPTRLNRVEIGDLMLHDVAAMVLPDGALSDNLLGLSFLSRLRRFEYSEGKLVLEQ
jgi:aspartyl protease family protein